MIAVLIAGCWLFAANLPLSLFAHDDYFGIRVIDSATGRGVPLVTLQTVNNISWVTDSAGWIAMNEPELMDRDVYFFVSSHGYEVAADGFGYRGVKLRPVAGETATVAVGRLMIAERIGRLTGAGIFRDSELLGLREPTRSSGNVLGQDTVQTAIFDDRLYWFWGDTNRAGYPLGNFKTSGAVSDYPVTTDPADEPLELRYFVNEQGFSREMAPIDGPGAVWLHGVFVLKHENDSSMFAHYARVKSLDERLEHGIVRFDRALQVFVKAIELPESAKLYPRGQSLQIDVDGQKHIAFAAPFPFVRVAADESAVLAAKRYETFTCLQPRTDFRGRESLIERDADGDVVWNWKADTDAIDPRRERELAQAELLQPSERRCVIFAGDRMLDVVLHAGSVHWNDFRKRWIMIAVELEGEHSYLGDVWYAEAESLEGPWKNAVQVCWHDQYTFYNPAHHPFLDRDGGRVIYFEGTYATTFSGARSATPRYDYNQVLYRLDLADPRLGLVDGAGVR